MSILRFLLVGLSIWRPMKDAAEKDLMEEIVRVLTLVILFLQLAVLIKILD